MQIDWLTVAAQAVNFLILVFLLERFLYRPVLAAMSRRESRIAQRLSDAEQREADATRAASDYEQRMREIESRREALAAEAREQAGVERERLLEVARREVEATEARWRADLEREKQSLRRALRRDLALAAQAIARRSLADLADAPIEARAIELFIERLGQLDAADLDALRDDAAGLVVATAFPVDEEGQQRIVDALRRYVEPDVTPVFSAAPELVCGIEVCGAGRRLGWSVADYLEQVEAGITEQLAAAGATEAASASDSAQTDGA